MSAYGDEALVSRVFQHGIDAFKSENYRRAIHFFDQALQAWSKKSKRTLRINILDSRAAAKEKIDDLKGGLADAKLIIGLAPECPKGYIRAARLFQKIGRFTPYIRMLERAIDRLSYNKTKNLSMIELLNAELKQARLGNVSCATAEASPSGSSKSKQDLWGALPFELLVTIVTFLDWPARFRCMAVCQSWRNTILNTPRLWTSLSLASENHSILIPKVEFWLDRLGPDQHLQTLFIHAYPTWPDYMTHDLLLLLISKSSKSTRLPQTGLQSFSFRMGTVFHGFSTMQDILCDVVSFLHLIGINLVNLELQLPAFITCPLPINVFLDRFPRLKKLKLHGKRDQFLVLVPGPVFFRPLFGSSRAARMTPRSLDDNFQNSSLAHSVSDDNFQNPSPAHSVCSEQDSHSVETELETLLLQYASFTRGTNAGWTVNAYRDTAINPTTVIDFTCLHQLENLELCRVTIGQEQLEPVWQSCQQLPRLKRLRLEGHPHFIPHFLDLANLPEDWSPQSYVDQPYKVDIGSVLPQIECICLSLPDSLIGYKFLAVFGYQFLKLDSLSVVGLTLDSTTEPLLISAFRHLPPLVNINLSNTHATSELINVIKPDRLIHLQLANCTRVTFRSLASLIIHQFSHLDITGCQLISTREMIEWLAQRVDSLIWKADRTGNNKAVKHLFLN